MAEAAKELGFLGLSVTRSGKFFRNGRELKVVYGVDRCKGRKCTAKIVPNKDGKTYYFQAAKLVAKAFCYGYTDDSYIIYKDCDCHNICADNLIVTDKDGYWEYMQRNSGYNADSMEKRIEKLNRVIKEATLTRDFFLTRSFKDINRHVEKELIPILNDYCRRTIYLGIEKTSRIVPEALARMYEVIDNDMCLYNYERWCKKLLLNYKKTGSFGLTGSVPKPIHKEIEKLNLDCLKEKYNVKPIK